MATENSTTAPPPNCMSVTGSAWMSQAAPTATMCMASTYSDDRATSMWPWHHVISTWPNTPVTNATITIHSQSSPPNWANWRGVTISTVGGTAATNDQKLIPAIHSIGSTSLVERAMRVNTK